MSDRIGYMIGAAVDPAVALYAAFRSKRDATAASHVLGILAALMVVGFLVSSALWWLILEVRPTLALTAALAIAAGVGLWFALRVWQGATWALLTFGIVGVIMMGLVLMRPGVGSGGIMTISGSVLGLSVWLASWNILKDRLRKPPPSTPEAE